MSTIDKKIPSLDGLRAVAISLVLIMHLAVGFPQWMFRYLQHTGLSCFGRTGVTIFFVISGFLITTLLLNEKFSAVGEIHIRNFYVRRALRILPVSMLYIGLLWFLNKPFDFGLETFFLWHALTYTMNFAVASMPWILAHLWSLGVEEQFYLIWPWVTKLQLKTIVRTAFYIIGYAPMARIIVAKTPEWKFAVLTLSPFFQYADALMIGCLLAISRRMSFSLWDSHLLKSRFLRFLSFFIIWLVTYLSSKHGRGFGYFTVPFGTSIISILSAYIIASTMTFDKTMLYRFLNHPLMMYVGRLSYSLYIWQQFFLVPRNFAGMPMWWRVFPMNIVLTFGVSMLSYHIWEKHFLKLKGRFKAA
ncbi:MAG: acyltransferase [Candidatus Omnitrophica bacterium]|nr:acyltransferase [Candidatus Omnitrophota bacterium]